MSRRPGATTARGAARLLMALALSLPAACSSAGDVVGREGSASSGTSGPRPVVTSEPGTTGSRPSTPTSPPVTAPTSAPGTSGSASSSPGTSGGPVTSDPGATGALPPFGAADVAVELGFPGTNALATLRAVRIGRQPGFDRVVFEFGPDDELPGVVVRPQSLPVTQDPSDLPLAVGGDRALLVRMQAASRARLTPTGDLELVYDGPLTVTGGSGAVVDATWAGDFEALLSWAVGVNGAHGYRVFTLQDPPRVVLDVATAPG